MSFPDKQILSRVRQGDEAAFAQLHSYFHAPALKFCTKLLKDDTGAEHITSAVFARIWACRSQINPEDSFQVYLFSNLKDQLFKELIRFRSDQQLRQQYTDRVTIMNDSSQKLMPNFS